MNWNIENIIIDKGVEQYEINLDTCQIFYCGTRRVILMWRKENPAPTPPSLPNPK